MEIPPEIITDILYRLPAKSLARFKSVSKNWLSLISQPQFIKTHQTTFNHHHHLICDSNNGSLYSLPLKSTSKPTKIIPKLPQTDTFIFLGSCNGLVLISFDNFINNHSHSLVVLNPTTNEVIELPESGYEVISNLLDIDIMYGFGYDSSSDDYKVVTVSYFHYNYLIPPDVMSVNVYSVRSNAWRRVSDSCFDHSHGKSLPGVYVDGFLHWIANKGCDGLPVIVAFSLADEEFREVPSPYSGDGFDIMSTSDCKLGGGGEKLGVLMKDGVWLMKEFGVRESWTKILNYSVSEITVVEPKIFYDGSKIMLLSGNLMWVYDDKEESLCETIDISRDIKGLKVKGTYVESLVSPKFSNKNCSTCWR